MGVSKTINSFVNTCVNYVSSPEWSSLALVLTGITMFVSGMYYIIALVNTPVLSGSDAENIRGLYELCIANSMISGVILASTFIYKTKGSE